MSRSPGRFISALFLFSLYSCNGEPPCFNPPLLTDTGGLSVQVNLETDSLSLDSSRDASFSLGGKFTGHVFGISGQTSIGTVLSANLSAAAPALALYGPRSNDGLFGRPIAQTCGTKGQESRLISLMLERPGDYLIITADPAGAGGDYSLSLNCSSGCDQPQCEPLVCDLYCSAGLARDIRGCQLCECGGCVTDQDCPRGFTCRGDTCLLENPCGCQSHPYDPVCGADNRTYPNECELECAGIEKAHDGVCPPGCASDEDCPSGTQCINGECMVICDCSGYGYDPVCGTDGNTYLNDCERVCAGAVLAHQGECEQCNPEVCDQIDNNCDGIIDEGCGGACTSDAECDIREICWGGYCVGALPCTADSDCPAGQLCQNGICRGEAGCEPEICDGIDNDCDGYVDDGCPACRSDEDCPDGQVCNLLTGECQAPCEDLDSDGYLGCQDDCDDLDASIHPGAVEQCDYIDNNCDGRTDEDFDFLIDPQNCGACGIVCPDQECYQGACVAGGCISVDECDDGDPGTEDHCAQEVCVHLAICTADTDCSTGQVCLSGICLGQGNCVADADCPAPEFCEPNSGVCVLHCRVEACPVGQVCHLGYCAP